MPTVHSAVYWNDGYCTRHTPILEEGPLAIETTNERVLILERPRRDPAKTKETYADCVSAAGHAFQLYDPETRHCYWYVDEVYAGRPWDLELACGAEGHPAIIPDDVQFFNHTLRPFLAAVAGAKTEVQDQVLTALQYEGAGDFSWIRPGRTPEKLGEAAAALPLRAELEAEKTENANEYHRKNPVLSVSATAPLAWDWALPIFPYPVLCQYSGPEEFWVHNYQRLLDQRLSTPVGWAVSGMETEYDCVISCYQEEWCRSAAWDGACHHWELPAIHSAAVLVPSPNTVLWYRD